MDLEAWFRGLIGNEEQEDKLLMKFSASELSKATDEFSQLLRRGGFGEVFYGSMVVDGEEKQVAVKKLQMDAQDFGSFQQFLGERRCLERLHHPSLLKLYGYCREGRMLVYEFLPGGDVDTLLDQANCGEVEFSWTQRMTVAADAASGLKYLHDCNATHGDFKPHNVMLDSVGRAKISDFCVTRRRQDAREFEVQVDARVDGSMQYLDNDYLGTGNLNPSCDVYAFGVFLMELITGVRARDQKFQSVRNTMVKGIKRHEVGFLDPNLKGQCDVMEVLPLARLAVEATRYGKEERPSMGEIVKKLEEVRLKRAIKKLKTLSCNEHCASLVHSHPTRKCFPAKTCSNTMEGSKHIY